MKNFNQVKTDELLKGLSEEGTTVGIENIDKFLQQQGVLVKIHIGRSRNYIEVNPKIFGVNVEQSVELNEFFNEYIKNGTMTFIPNSDEKILHNIEAKVRVKRDRMAIGYDNEYMPLEIYKEFAEYVKDAKEEYFEARDQIVSRWDDLITRFKEILKTSLDQMNAVNKLNVYEQVIEKLPSKDDYINSFYINISLRAFPVSENLSLFDENISEQIKQTLMEDSINSVHEILGNALEDSFTTVNNILVSYDKNGRIANKTMGGLKEGAKRIRQKNLFKNPVIDSIADDMNDMFLLGEGDEIAEKAEIVLSKIYGYANEVGLNSLINFNKSVLDEEELSLIYKSYKMEK